MLTLVLDLGVWRIFLLVSWYLRRVIEQMVEQLFILHRILHFTMTLSSHLVPPFFEGNKLPATITMLMGQTELAPCGPNSLLLCSQELPTSLPVSASPPAGTFVNAQKRGRSPSTARTPATDDDEGMISTPPSTPPSRAASIPRSPSTTRITRARVRAHLSTLPPHQHRDRTPSVPQPPKKRRRVQILTPSLSPESLDSSASDPSSGTEIEIDQEFDESDDADAEDEGIVGLIVKPAGEAGRPGRGGYNLKEALGWSLTDFNQLKVTSVIVCSSGKI